MKTRIGPAKKKQKKNKSINLIKSIKKNERMLKGRKETREGREGGRKEDKVSNQTIESNVNKTNFTLSRTFFAKKFHCVRGPVS